MASHRRIALWWAIIAVVWVGVYVAVTWGTRFDSQTWKDAASDPWVDRRRANMVENLLEKHPLKGMRRHEVEELLGPPDRSKAELAGRPPRPNTTVYRLGLGFIDSEWMVLTWTAEDVVSDVRIITD